MRGGQFRSLKCVDETSWGFGGPFVSGSDPHDLPPVGTWDNFMTEARFCVARFPLPSQWIVCSRRKNGFRGFETQPVVEVKALRRVYTYYLTLPSE